MNILFQSNASIPTPKGTEHQFVNTIFLELKAKLDNAV